ncbi:MAG: helix-turn-helix transcriptional regulator [Firmicutes bacterium]|nr:helix-turn-helix transcriptional regulator [Bacillota bacterium]
MIDWNEQQQWTVGDIVRRMREEAKIGLEQLSRGLCSVATLSRIEAGEREMELLLAWRIFQRLGYKIDKYELYATEEELQQWEQRSQMEELVCREDTERLACAIQTYRQQWGKRVEENPLQRQFLAYMQGLLDMQKGDFQEAKELLEAAAEEIVPSLEETVGNAALGEMLLENIGREKKRVKSYLKLYTEFFCKHARNMMETKGSARTLNAAETCLQILQEEKKTCCLPELLHIQAKCLEDLFQKKGEVKEVMLKSWQKAYYIYRLYEKQEEAEKIRKYLEETYQWDCII